jgi:hypothetical protein
MLFNPVDKINITSDLCIVKQECGTHETYDNACLFLHLNKNAM